MGETNGVSRTACSRRMTCTISLGALMMLFASAGLTAELPDDLQEFSARCESPDYFCGCFNSVPDPTIFILPKKDGGVWRCPKTFIATWQRASGSLVAAETPWPEWATSQGFYALFVSSATHPSGSLRPLVREWLKLWGPTGLNAIHQVQGFVPYDEIPPSPP